MNFNPQEYIALESDSFPYLTDWGFTLKEINGRCSTCGKELTGLKHTIADYSDFSVIRGVGVCYPCKLIVTIHPLKITGQGESFLLKDGQWIKLADSWLDKLLKWFKK